MKYMLDITTSVYLMKYKPQNLKLKLQKIKPENLLISNISVSELFFGVYNSKDIKKNLGVLEKFLLGLETMDYDFDASIEYGKIKSDLVKSHKYMKNIDIQIAAHAKSLKSVLITNNIEEFKKIKGIKLQNWIS